MCSAAHSLAAGIVLGDSFLRSAYVVVYDLMNNQIAIAQAALNATSTSAIVEIPPSNQHP
jgi:Eukaryotic aspartyl protease